MSHVWVPESAYVYVCGAYLTYIFLEREPNQHWEAYLLAFVLLSTLKEVLVGSHCYF